MKLSIPPKVTRRLLPLAASLCVSLVLAGCATPTLTPTQEQSTARKDPLALPESRPIGIVFSVNADEGIALIEVRSSSTRVGPALITRNELLKETSRLEPTRFQRGRTLGARIISGLPNVGDEVFLE